MSTKTYENVQDLIKDLLNFNIVINVKSQEQAEEFVRIMRNKYNMGYHDRSYDSNYGDCCDKTCYTFRYGKNRMVCDNIDYYGKYYKGTKIIPYSSVRELLIGK